VSAGQQAPVPPTLPTAPTPRLTSLPSGLRAFGHYNFRLYYSGQGISLIGTWMQSVAQAWLVLELTNDPLALGIVGALRFGPVLVLGLFGGLIADAVSKRAALVITQLSAAAISLTLGILVASGTVEVWHVYVLALLLGVVNAFDMPIRQAFVVEMVGREDVANAVALNSALFNMARIVGPAIAGLMIAAIGLVPLFFIDAVSYLAVVTGLLLLHIHELNLPLESMVFERHWRSVLARLAEGLRYVRSQREILLAISVLGVVSLFALNFNVLIPVLARDTLNGDADTYGFLMSASGLGSLVSALSIAFGQRPSMGRLLTGAAVVGLAMVALGISRMMWLDLGLMFLAGWGTISMAATCNTIIQLTVPDVLRGRVMSVYTTVFAGVAPFGALFSGSLASAGGAPTGLLAGGAIACVAAVAGLALVPGGVRLAMVPIASWRPGGLRRPTLNRRR
jgi:MFS family permease